MPSEDQPTPLFAEDEPTALEGVVQRIVYSNADTAWAVVRLLPDSTAAVTTVVGPLFGVQVGEHLRLVGEWVVDRKFGRQFRATAYLGLEPTTVDGIRSYLGSGLIPGIGPVMAQRLVERFGLRTLQIIDLDPGRLSEVPGIGARRAEQIRRAWREQRGMREILVFLQAHGVTPGQALRIHRRYGDRAIAAVKSNPYRLAADVFGIGFRTADEIAARIGIARDAKPRAEAGILHALEQAEGQGHVFYPASRLQDDAAALLDLPPDSLPQALGRLVASSRIIQEPADAEGVACFRPALFAAEVGIAERIARLVGCERSDDETDWDRELSGLEQQYRLSLAPQQRKAVLQALTSRVLVITGGPGTGKTTLVRAIVDLLARTQRKVLLAAPTGRAAKRLSEATGHEARTIHRLLEFEPRHGTFRRHQQRPLDADLILVDEASMLDCLLARDLFEAVSDHSRLVLVGDVDQLPSVGPGQILSDLIKSGVCPVIRLQKVFRQAASSLIIANAHKILHGDKPQLETARPVDFYFIARNQPEEILATIEHLITERVPQRFGLDPRHDIQVLTPMRRGLVGADSLNHALQEVLNPDASPIEATRGKLRLGDRVMQSRNNYTLEVFNGDIGQIAGYSSDRREVEVQFDERTVRYDSTELDELTLAYACSVHKSQGSEYPCVILPLHTQHAHMLQRNLLYTAITRGRALVILVGETRALERAVYNARQQERFSRLAERLRQQLRESHRRADRAED